MCHFVKFFLMIIGVGTLDLEVVAFPKATGIFPFWGDSDHSRVSGMLCSKINRVSFCRVQKILQ